MGRGGINKVYSFSLNEANSLIMKEKHLQQFPEGNRLIWKMR